MGHKGGSGGLVSALVFVSLPLSLILLSGLICMAIDWDTVSAWASVYLQISLLTALYTWRDAQFIVYDEGWNFSSQNSFNNMLKEQKTLYVEFFRRAPPNLIGISLIYGGVYILCHAYRYLLHFGTVQ